MAFWVPWHRKAVITKESACHQTQFHMQISRSRQKSDIREDLIATVAVSKAERYLRTGNQTFTGIWGLCKHALQL
eukprot:444114-Amphidinium_carterae.1